MANLNTLTFSQVVQQIATAAQAKAPLPFNLGSPELALAEADASVVMWLQSLIVDVLATTRASTSQGPDLDSWMADFGLTRLPATNATGTLTFSRYTATNAATIPVGTQVQSQDGAVTYAVIADTTQPLFSVALNAYLIPAGIASGNVTAQAVTPGAAGNVQIGVLTSLTSSIQNVDTVTNPAAITNGIDAETDAAFRNRFQLYLGSFEKGTKNAIAYALASMQQGITYTLTENQNYAGAQQLGYFYVVVDNGTGSPPSALITAAASAIDAVRPVGTLFNVYAPVIVTANVTCNVTAQPGYSAATVQANVVTAVTNYINSLQLGQPLMWSILYSVAYAVPGVQEVSGLLLNGGTADLPCTTQQVIKAGTVTA